MYGTHAPGATKTAKKSQVVGGKKKGAHVPEGRFLQFVGYGIYPASFNFLYFLCLYYIFDAARPITCVEAFVSYSSGYAINEQ